MRMLFVFNSDSKLLRYNMANGFSDSSPSTLDSPSAALSFGSSIPVARR